MSVKITRTTDEASALEIASPDYRGHLVRHWIPDPKDVKKSICGKYVNSGGHEYSCLSYTISGAVIRQRQENGQTMYQVLPASKRPEHNCMLVIWNDVDNSIIGRAANIPADQSYFFRTLDYETSDGSEPYTNLDKCVERFAQRMDGRHEWKSRSGLKAIVDCGEGPPTAECDAGFYLQMNDGGAAWLCRNGQWMKLQLEEEAEK